MPRFIIRTLSRSGISQSTLLRSVFPSKPRTSPRKQIKCPKLTCSSQISQESRFSSISSKMSYSNADTGNKPADPYTAKAKDDSPLPEKVEAFTKFIKSCKFAMMTTRTEKTGMLTSRAMALAATVR